MFNFLKKIVTESAITVVAPNLGRPITMSSKHRLFPQLQEAVKNNDIDKINRIINQAEEVKIYTQGRVSVRNGQVFINTPEGEEAVAGPVVSRILKAMLDDKPNAPVVQFLDNLALNPSGRARSELYSFLEATNLPITTDGRFMAYKWVTKDYWDVHTGNTFMNKPGHIIRMPRHKVNDNPNQTCSYGLHVCGAKYSKFGERLVLVAINPSDVVSVPVDYQAHKMRVCQYEVISEIEPEDYTKSIYENMDIYSIEEIKEAHLKQLEEARQLEEEFFKKDVDDMSDKEVEDEFKKIRLTPDFYNDPEQDDFIIEEDEQEEITPSGTIQEKVPFTQEEWEFLVKQVRNKRAYSLIQRRFPEKDREDLQYYADLIRKVDRGQEQIKFIYNK